jgi:Flp pilus assembly pilin Flp
MSRKSNPLHHLLLREDGQTMAEYGVVFTVITLAVVTAMSALAGGITNAVNGVIALLS